MSKILKNLITGRTGNSYPWRTPLSAIPLEAELETVNKAKFPDFVEEWEMKFTLKTVFKCRHTDYWLAAQNAEKMLMQGIYSDMLGKIALLRGAIYGDDIEGAMNLLDEMQKEMGL